jgi:hypothetical protein
MEGEDLKLIYQTKFPCAGFVQESAKLLNMKQDFQLVVRHDARRIWAHQVAGVIIEYPGAEQNGGTLILKDHTEEAITGAQAAEIIDYGVRPQYKFSARQR